MKKAIQDLYPDDLSYCYGCGRNNPDGFHLKTYLENDETITRFTPDPKYVAIPGAVFGGLIASLFDCHGTGSAAAFICQAENISMDSPINIRCVTGSLKVNFIIFTPVNTELEVIGKLRKIEGRKVWVDMTLTAKGEVRATAEILAIRLKE